MEVKILTNRWLPRKKVWFNFDMYAWDYVCKMHDIEITELNTIDNEVLVYDLFYAAAVSYCKDHGKKVSFDKNKLLGWIDKLSKFELDRLQAEFKQSRIFGKTMEQWGEQGSGLKKK